MKIFVFFLVFNSICLTAAAQSGRRVQNALPDSVSEPQVRKTTDTNQDGVQADDSVGYSDSAPNSPRVLLPKSKNIKKSNKNTTKDADSPVSSDTADSSKSDEEIIKVETNLITVPVSVSDRNGFYVANLHESDFKIFEDGIEQKVEYFGTSEKPFTVVLLIDVSPSTAYKIEEIQAAASAFVAELLPQDQVMVIEFDSSVRVLTEITGDREKVNKAIRRVGFGDGTSLYEAVDFSLKKRLDKIEGRKAIVLFTDGVDTSSVRAGYENTLKEAEESEAIIFPIYFNTFLNQIGIGGGGVMSTTPTLGVPGVLGGRANNSMSAEYARGRAYLTELATVTGGKLFRAESTPGGLTNAFESIAEELRRQYTIGYYPTAAAGAAGGRKQIRVRVDRPKLIVRSRDSYIVGATVKGS